ncbi:hypothetical protein ACTXT7_002546 [Hymenolepis weldensis]
MTQFLPLKAMVQTSANLVGPMFDSRALSLVPRPILLSTFSLFFLAFPLPLHNITWFTLNSWSSNLKTAKLHDTASSTTMITPKANSSAIQYVDDKQVKTTPEHTGKKVDWLG